MIMIKKKVMRDDDNEEDDGDDDDDDGDDYDDDSEKRINYTSKLLCGHGNDNPVSSLIKRTIVM